MADKLKEIPAKILEWWNKFTTRQKSIIVGSGGGCDICICNHHVRYE